MNTKTLLMAAMAVVTCCATLRADVLAAKASFDKNEIRLYAQPLAYEVVRGGKTLVAKTPIGVKVDGVCAVDAKLLGAQTKALAGSVATPVYKKASVDLSGTETFADFGDFGVRLVARADGVAYRFELKKGGTIQDEKASVTIPSGAARCWFCRTTAFGSEERWPEIKLAKELKTDAKAFFYPPFVYAVEGSVVAVAEADIHDYPAWYLKNVETTADGGVRLDSYFAAYPKRTERVGGWGEVHNLPTGGRWMYIHEFESYLVKAPAGFTLPWRAFVLADKLEKLCENDLMFALAKPQAEGSDFSWVKPGKVAWDWWSAFDNKGEEKGCTTEGYKRFIDFAAKNGVEYVIFDEGWSETLNIWKYSPRVDVPFLIDYAKKKGVDIILWMAWAQIFGQEEKVAAHFAKLGAKGFKVDFMDRADAQISNFLEKFAAACAKEKMLVDYHGVYRPVGLHRTYPNLINYEGIHGLEQMKFTTPTVDMPFNDVACFFIRMTAGPMDYTPGAMNNYKVGEYKGTYQHPGSAGTRAHQMALMALYEAPLQMLCDSPTNYEKNMECFSFMAKTPVVWNATVGLPGTPETVAAVARQAKDGAWFVAGITNRDARDYTLDTSFLGKKGMWDWLLGGEKWTVEIFRDADDSDDKPMNYIHETKTIKAGEKVTLRMANGGGFVMKFSK